MPTTRAGDTMPAMLNTVIRSSDRTGWLISLGLALAALLWWAGLSQRVASPTPTAEIFGAWPWPRGAHGQPGIRLQPGLARGCWGRRSQRTGRSLARACWAFRI
ncbi:MAG: hypothetical protein R2873_14880 [Caldilineaceae bacterium]